MAAFRAVVRPGTEPIPDLLEFAGQTLWVPEKPLFLVETLAFPLAGEGGAVMLFIFESWIGPEQFVATPAPVFSFCHRRIPPVERIIDETAQEEDQDWIRGIRGRRTYPPNPQNEQRKKKRSKKRKKTLRLLLFIKKN